MILICGNCGNQHMRVVTAGDGYISIDCENCNASMVITQLDYHATALKTPHELMITRNDLFR